MITRGIQFRGTAVLVIVAFIVRFATRIRELVERDCIMSNVSVFSMNRIYNKESIASTRGARRKRGNFVVSFGQTVSKRSGLLNRDYSVPWDRGWTWVAEQLIAQ